MSSLLKLSFFVRKLTLLSNHTVRPTRFLRTSSYCKARMQKAISENEEPTQLSNQPALAMVSKKSPSLMTKLHYSPTQVHVFQLINENENKMNAVEAVKALKVLFVLDNRAEKPDLDISKTKEFAKLCEILMRDIRELNENDAVSALKVLTHFRVPTSTVISQMLLRIICNSVNDLSIEQILFLNFLLTKCQKIPLVEALSIALPIVLRSNIKSKLITENVDTFVKLLQYFSHNHRVDKEIISIILNALNNVDESLIKPDHARIIMSIIQRLDSDNTSIEVFRKCQKVFTNLEHDIEPSYLTEICKIAVQEEQYNGDTLDACAMTIVSKNVSLGIAVEVLRRLNHFVHINESLLDYITAECIKHMEMGEKIEIELLATLTTGLSYANYKPECWNKFEELANDKISESLNCLPKSWLKTALHLAHIDCYWPKLLAKVFTNNLITNKMNFLTKHRFLNLYRIVKIHYPKYDGPWPSDEVLELCESIPQNERNFPCKSALEFALGGSQYVITGVESAMHFKIDHVAMMRQGGFPIAVQNLNEPMPLTVENLKPPKDGQVLIFVCINEHGCSRNTGRLIGHWSFLIRNLELQKSHTVIPIYYDTWNESSESVKVKKILQSIKLKTDELLSH